jgi:phenylalanyl-tRNA synthetase beta chain
MRASLKWLQRYADIPSDPHEIASRLTMAGYVVASHERSGLCRQNRLAAAFDTAFDVEVTFNRPDLLCHLGLARELAGIFGVALRAPETAVDASVGILDSVPVAVESADLCPIYTARVVRGVRVGPSPAWLVSVLEAAGQRSVNNVVDVTNFVMLELGQPLHAFDLAKIVGLLSSYAARAGNRRRDRRARTDVGPDDPAICDDSAPVASA